MANTPTRTGSARREILFSVGVLFLGAVLVVVAAVAVAFPFLPSPGSALLFLSVILAADLVVLFLFLRSLLSTTLFDPLERIGESAERISEGEYAHRIPEVGGEELERLSRSLNVMAERLIRNQERLEENVRSLDRTNRELVETTDALVRTAQLASLGTLAGGIAHEVGNPLGAVISYLDVARNRQPPGSSALEPIDAAQEEARRIDRIIRSVLEFARPSGLEGEVGTARVEETMDRVVTLLEGRGALQGVIVTVDRGETPAVRGRPQHLEQIFMNLLMNAVRATAGQEIREVRIWITAEAPRQSGHPARREADPPGIDYSHRRRIPFLPEARLSLEGDTGLPDAVVTIADSGPGIADADLPRIFDPFFTTRAPGEGTGLGLSLTARIVHGLGGSIEARNQAEGGAVFALRFPGAGEAPPAMYTGEGKTVE